MRQFVMWLLVHLVGVCAGQQLLLPRDLATDIALHEAVEALDGKADVDVDVDAILSTCGNRTHFTMTLRGSKGAGMDINQDRAFIYFMENGGMLQVVLDGHGGLGHNVSQFGVDEIPGRLEKLLTQTQNVTLVEEALIQVAHDVDDAMPEDIGARGGATLTMVLLLENRLYFANAGDSQSFLAHGSSVVYATRLDKPDEPSEKARVLEMGGRVSEASAYDDARVYYTHSNGHQYGLAMSRSIGDHGATGVIPTPVVYSLDMEELKNGKECEAEVLDDGSVVEDCLDAKWFVVSASDGVLDYQELGKIAGVYNTVLFSGDRHPIAFTRQFLYETAKLWQRDTGGTYRDDMVFAVSVV